MPAAFILTPKSPADYANNIRAARAFVGTKLGLPIPEGTAAEYQALSQADQIRVADEVSAMIVAQPDFFTADQVALAQKRVDSPVYRQPLADTSLAASAGEFFSDLAGRAESKLTMIIFVGVIVAVAAAVLPGAIARARLAKP